MEGIAELLYYRELDGNAVVESLSLKNMDLGDLQRLAADEEEGSQSDTEQHKYMGHVYYYTFLKTGATEDLERALDRTKKQIPIRIDNPGYASSLKDLIIMLVKRYQHTRSQEDLQEAIFRAQEMVAATSLDHPDRWVRMLDWTRLMFMKPHHTGSPGDLIEATLIAREAGVHVAMDTLGGGLFEVELNTSVYEHITELHCDMAWMGNFTIDREIGPLLLDRDVEDLLSFAELYEDPTSTAEIESIICTFFILFMKTALVEYLEKAIQRAKGWKEVMAHDHPDQARRMRILYTMFAWKCQLELPGDAMAATPADHPNRAYHLGKLGNWFGMRYERTKEMVDLDKAIKVTKSAVEAVNYPDRAHHARNLGILFDMRYKQTGEIGDLDQAIQVTEDAVKAISVDHPHRADSPDHAICLNRLGAWFGIRYERTGNMGDLNKAIEVARNAVAATSTKHPDRANHLSNLGNWFARRFEWTRETGDINEAIKVTESAEEASKADYLNQANHLGTLGTWLRARFEQTREISDLNRAVEVTERAIKATPVDHPNQNCRLNNLGNLLGAQFEQTRKMSDLNRAVEVTESAVVANQADYLNQAGSLINLGIWLGIRFDQTGEMDDLNRAIEVSKKAIENTPTDHPRQATFLNYLGRLLSKRFPRTKDLKEFEQTFLSFKNSWNRHNAPTSIRIKSAKQVAGYLAILKNWEESSNILQDAVVLLPSLSPRSLENTDKQYILAEISGLASMAAATALNAGRDAYHALKLLELGRGVIAGLLLEMRTDISAVREKHPELAKDFESLRDELDLPQRETALPISNDITPSWEDRAKRRREADLRFTGVCKEIRALPGFQNFLLPPTANELMAAAKLGPIAVINADYFGCDAFLIESRQIRNVRLEGLSPEKVEEMTRDSNLSSSSTLETLWDLVAHPILDALGFQGPPSDDNWPHIWWVPTGSLSRLPLHAAGYHKQRSNKTVLDRVMSSYNSSVKALIHGRQQSIRTTVGAISEQALLVAMPKTPENSDLPFATNEREMLKSLCSSLQLEPIIPPSRKKDVLTHLRTCKIFHFAGHGLSHNSDPSRSCLLLEDWKGNPLTVRDLRDHKLQENPPFLGYLSACSTGTNMVNDLVDEGIHLVSAFQLAGFRHVIGTLWEVSDSHCVDIAASLYKTISEEGMTDLTICRGLHRAVRALRDRHITVDNNTPDREFAEVNDTEIAEPSQETRPQMGRDAMLCSFESSEEQQENPKYWAPYIHFGV